MNNPNKRKTEKDCFIKKISLNKKYNLCKTIKKLSLYFKEIEIRLNIENYKD
jgi:hypothetical protein